MVFPLKLDLLSPTCQWIEKITHLFYFSILHFVVSPSKKKIQFLTLKRFLKKTSGTESLNLCVDWMVHCAL